MMPNIFDIRIRLDSEEGIYSVFIFGQYSRTEYICIWSKIKYSSHTASAKPFNYLGILQNRIWDFLDCSNIKDLVQFAMHTWTN